MAREYDYDREQDYEEVYDEDYDSEEDGAEEELSLIDRILIGIGVKKPTSSVDKTNEDERSPIKEEERERNPFGGSRNLNKGIELDENQNRARGNDGNIGVVGRKGCDNIELMRPCAFDDKEMLKAVTSVREQGRVIILNLELCDATTQMNFYTYAMGLCAGVKGKMAQVSQSILIIAPQSVTLTGYSDSAAGQVDPLMAAVSG